MPYFVTADNSRIYYTYSNPGPAWPVVVFLNGLAQTTTYWHPQQQYFGRNFRILRYDARTQGRSDPGTGPLTADTHISDLASLCDHLNIGSAAFVGLSHGAYVALGFAARHTHRVQKLIVCSLRAGLYRDAGIVDRWLQKLKEAGLESFARDVIATATGQTFRARYANIVELMAQAVAARNSAAGLRLQLEAMQNYPPATTAAARVQAPALVIAGEEDRIVPAEDAQILASRMNAALQRVPRAGHSLPIEAPAVFNALVANFLRPAT